MSDDDQKLDAGAPEQPEPSPETSAAQADEATAPSTPEAESQSSSADAVEASAEPAEAVEAVEPAEAVEAVEADAAEQPAQADEAAEAVSESSDDPAPVAAEEPQPEATSSPEATAPAASEAPEPKDSAAETGGEPESAEASPAEAAEEALPPELAPIVEAMENKSRVSGKVIGWNKGGFHVALDTVAAFCPKSQMELGNPKKASAYLDKALDFKVIEIKEAGKRIVVSRVPVLREDRRNLIGDLKARVESKEPLSGKIRSVTDFGAFVALGSGIEGLVHRSQLTRRRFDEPREVVQIGQAVDVRVLKVEKGGDRISLSMKALEPDPWSGLGDKMGIGDTFSGTIVRKSDFGLFVEVLPGVEGLLHESQLPIGKSLASSDYDEGKQVEGWVREVDAGRNRLSLSLREVSKTDPWKDIQSRFEEGQKVTGTVEQVAKFGVFVQLEPGLTGLLPASTIGSGEGMRLDRRYRPGSQVEVVVDSIEAKRKRISLALPGAKLEGTKADLKEFQKKQSETSTPSLNAMAAAFAKLKQD